MAKILFYPRFILGFCVMYFYFEWLGWGGVGCRRNRSVFLTSAPRSAKLSVFLTFAHLLCSLCSSVVFPWVCNQMPHVCSEYTLSNIQVLVHTYIILFEHSWPATMSFIFSRPVKRIDCPPSATGCEMVPREQWCDGFTTSGERCVETVWTAECVGQPPVGCEVRPRGHLKKIRIDTYCKV